MDNNGVKLIALDMDGTLLLSDHKTIHPENIRAIRTAQEAGLAVFISTGRLPEDVTDFLRRDALEMGMICCNGAVAYAGPLPDGRQMVKSTFKPETAHRVLDVLIPYGIMINAFEPGWVSTIARSPDHHYHLLSRNLIGEHRGAEALRASADRGILKFYCMEEPGWAHLPSEIIEAVRMELIRTCPDAQVTRSAPGIVEVMPLGVGKGQTLLAVAAQMGIGPESIMAVGDEENDLDMLERVSKSVAMGNASQRVLETCRYLTLSNDDAGVAEAINMALGMPSRCRQHKARAD